MTVIVNIIACKPRIYRLYGPSQESLMRWITLISGDKESVQYFLETATINKPQWVPILE